MFKWDDPKCYLDDGDGTLADIHEHIQELLIKYKELAQKGYRDPERGINV